MVRLLALVAVVGFAASPAHPDVVLDAASLERGPIPVTAWRFHVGDDPAWAAANLDEAGWETRSPSLFSAEAPIPATWTGIGWLRATLDVGANLVGRPLAVRLGGQAAVELWVDGGLVTTLGTVSADPAVAVPRIQQAPAEVVFDRPGPHQLALRFSGSDAPSFLRAIGSYSVTVTFDQPERATTALLAAASFRNRYLGWFCGIFLAFALLHLLLYLFHREIRANLDFALLCLVLAGLIFAMAYRHVQGDPRFWLFAEPAMGLLGLLLGITSLRFVYRVFYPRPPRLFRLYLAVATPIAVWNIVAAAAAVTAVFLLMLLAVGELVRVVVVALARRKPGAKTIGIGVLSLAAGFALGLLANLGVLPSNAVTGFLIPFYSVLGLLISMSVYLSRLFASMHRSLEARLREVERLSREALDSERRLRAEEVQRRVLETQYEQKVRELEEARELQLAVLPAALPSLPDLHVAAHMETATEVGGDYYDFERAVDGALVIAIGDATGHGMRAGMMVTATKSLFNALATEFPLLDTLGRSTRVLKRMNLRKLTMALTLARYQAGELRLAAAGMPPVLVYRAASGEVEQILLVGMPLGAMAKFPYREQTVMLAAGDTVLLMSDGFPERRNAAAEELGCERAVAAFAAVASRSPADIIADLRREAAAWAAGHPLDDDVTFVVLQVPAPTT